MKVQELLSSEDKWTKLSSARNEKGEPVCADSPEATQWCVYGALYKCYRPSKVSFLLRKIDEGENIDDIPTWNDMRQRTFKDVKALVKKYDI